MAKKCTRKKTVWVKGHKSKVCAKFSGSARRGKRKKGCSFGPRRKGKCPARK